YVVRLAPRHDRDRVIRELEARDIPARPYFPPIHLQPFYRGRFGLRTGDFPVTEAAGASCLALPFFGTMPEEQVDMACGAVALVLACKLGGFTAFRPSIGWWRQVNMHALADIVRGSVLASALLLPAVVFVRGLAGFPRSIFLLDLMLSTMLMAGLRLDIRLARE